MAASLIIASGGTKNKVFIQTAKVTVGRSPQSDITLNDEKVAAVHLAIIRTQNGYGLKTLAADAPTAVNGKAVRQVMLKSGDVIRLGDTKILFKADGQNQKAAAPAQGAARPAPAARRPGARATARPGHAKRPPLPKRAPAGRGRSRRGNDRRSKHLNQLTKGKRRSALPVVIMVASVLIVAAVLGIWLAPGGGNEEEGYLKAARGLQAGAVQEEQDGKLARALEKANDGVINAGKAGEKGSTLKMELKAYVSELEGKLALVAKAQQDFDALKKEYDEGIDPDNLMDYHGRLEALQDAHKSKKKLYTWFEASEGMRKTVEHMINTVKEQLVATSWLPFRTNVIEPLVKDGKFGEAVRQINRRKDSLKPTDQEKAQTYLDGQLQSAANTHYRRNVTREIRKFQRASDLDGAKAYLKEKMGDYDGTDASSTAKEDLEELEKGEWPRG